MKRAGWAKGESKGADEIFSASCQKTTAGKEVEWWGDNGKSRLRGKKLREETLCRFGTIVGLNLALIQESTKAQGKSEEGLHR